MASLRGSGAVPDTFSDRDSLNRPTQPSRTTPYKYEGMYTSPLDVSVPTTRETSGGFGFSTTSFVAGVSISGDGAGRGARRPDWLSPAMFHTKSRTRTKKTRSA